MKQKLPQAATGMASEQRTLFCTGMTSAKMKVKIATASSRPTVKLACLPPIGELECRFQLLPAQDNNHVGMQATEKGE